MVVVPVKLLVAELAQPVERVVIDWDLPQASASEGASCSSHEREVRGVHCVTVDEYLELAVKYAVLFFDADLPQPQPFILRKKLEHLREVFSKDSAVQRAVEWASDFEWDSERIDEDTNLINSLGIEGAITHMQDLHRPDRLNEKRVRTNFSPSMFERFRSPTDTTTNPEPPHTSWQMSMETCVGLAE